MWNGNLFYKNNRIVASYNSELNIPLASVAKLVIDL